jgi:hypothetical protein
MVTGPMPRKPKATRPKAKTGAATGDDDELLEALTCRSTSRAPIRATMTMPIQ